MAPDATSLFAVLQCDEELSTLVSALEPDAAKMSTEEAAAVYELWCSESIQRALDTNRKQPTQWVLDQTPYYLNNLQVAAVVIGFHFGSTNPLA